MITKQPINQTTDDIEKTVDLLRAENVALKQEIDKLKLEVSNSSKLEANAVAFDSNGELMVGLKELTQALDMDEAVFTQFLVKEGYLNWHKTRGLSIVVKHGIDRDWATFIKARSTNSRNRKGGERPILKYYISQSAQSDGIETVKKLVAKCKAEHQHNDTDV